MTLSAPALSYPYEARDEVADALTVLLADLFALHLKTKSFHWHVHGPHFREHHRLLDEQAAQLFAAADAVAERVRKRGASTLRSIGQVASLQRIADNEADYVSAREMLEELRRDNLQLMGDLRALHRLADDDGDIATASLIENWVDEAEGRVWFLTEATRVSNAEP